MDIQLSDLVTLLGIAAGFSGIWYKTAKDTDAKIEHSRETVDEQLKQLRDSVSDMRSTSISRVEHNQDIEKVQQVILSFRNEVREDIKSLNTTLTQRFDILMQRVLEKP